MGLQIDMSKTTHPDGSFTMTPIPEAFVGEKALERFLVAFGNGPVGPLKLDVDRDEKGQPRVLAGVQGPYARLFSRAFKHYERIPGREPLTFPATLLGTVQQVTVGGRVTLRLHPKLQRRFTRSQPGQPGAVGKPVAPAASVPKPAAAVEAEGGPEDTGDGEVPF